MDKFNECECGSGPTRIRTQAMKLRYPGGWKVGHYNITVGFNCCGTQKVASVKSIDPPFNVGEITEFTTFKKANYVGAVSGEP